MLVTRPLTVISPSLVGSAGSIEVMVMETKATGSTAAARQGMSSTQSPETATASSTRAVRAAYHLLIQVMVIGLCRGRSRIALGIRLLHRRSGTKKHVPRSYKLLASLAEAVAR